MQKILVSACLLGESVRYDGKNLRLEDKILQGWGQRNRIISFCPEVAGGLTVPRTAAEIIGGDGYSVLAEKARVVDRNGIDVTEPFINGAQQALRLCQQFGIGVALLSARSPSCGDDRIYNGQFNGSLISGAGVTAALLKQNGIKVFNQTRIRDANHYLDQLE